MKARSVIFTHIQTPSTIIGLPPIMMAASFGVSFVAYLTLTICGAPATAMFTFGGLMVLGMGASYGLSRHDHHVESILLNAFAFWFFSSRRWLLAGASPRSLGGRS